MPGLMLGQKPFGRTLSREVLHIFFSLSGKS
jgi:hypothetical protein